MRDPRPDLPAETPLFSIIIPLEYHRGQWERSWLGWMAQTVDKSLYEIILVVPPDFSGRKDLTAVVGDNARIVPADSSHDIGLCAAGAARAHGRYLFFTESHCWPEPDVLELCRRAVDDHPDWAGFSCRSVPICHNALSRAEAEMYRADIEFGMKAHPWRKVLDQCFVTRRDVYEECGGLRQELGHFAEWVLAAAYHARGHVIGYLEEARFHHYYVGRLADLKAFTLDFVQGEIRYLGEESRDPGREIVDIPIEWSCRENFDPGLARSALGALLRDGSLWRGWRGIDGKWRTFRRWVGPAISGDGLARLAALISAAFARCMVAVPALTRSQAGLSRWLTRYIAALIRLQRLNCIHAVPPLPDRSSPGSGHGVLARAGFHAPETWQGHSFRWSEPAAAIRIGGLPGSNIVRIRCLDARGPIDRVHLRFYFEAARLPDHAVTTFDDSFVLCVDLPPSGIARLAWVCSSLAANDDPRRLGLPVTAIEVGALSGGIGPTDAAAEAVEG